jgi:hypothetical protein
VQPRPGTVRRAVLVLATAGAALLAGCGGDVRAVSASLESPPRPAAEDPAGGASPELELPEELPGIEDLPGVEDLPLPDQLPGAADVEQCVELTTAYTEVQVLAFTGDPDGRIAELFDQLEAAAPSDVADDLAVVRSIIEGLGGDAGVLDTTSALLSSEYNTANEAVIGWLTELCGG